MPIEKGKLGDTHASSSNLRTAIDNAYGDTAKPTSIEADLRQKAEKYKASSEFHNVKRQFAKDLEAIRNMSDTSKEYLEEVTQSEAEVQKQLDDIIDMESESKALVDEADKLENEVIPEKVKEAQALLDEITEELEKTEAQLKEADCENDPAYCEKLNARITRLNEMQNESRLNLETLMDQIPKLQELRQCTNSISENIQNAIGREGNRQPGDNEAIRQQFKNNLAEAKETLSELSSAISGALSKARDLFVGIMTSIAKVVSSMTGLKTELADMKNNPIEPTPGLSATIK